jgi:hypothetical protein
MDPGVMAAIRRLPRHKKAIEELVLFSESFRGLCGDLADAEAALQLWQTSGDTGAAARCLEYGHIVDGLEAELRQAIHERQTQLGTPRQT